MNHYKLIRNIISLINIVLSAGVSIYDFLSAKYPLAVIWLVVCIIWFIIFIVDNLWNKPEPASDN